jgi:hypothetical protein
MIYLIQALRFMICYQLVTTAIIYLWTGKNRNKNLYLVYQNLVDGRILPSESPMKKEGPFPKLFEGKQLGKIPNFCILLEEV